RYACQPVSKTRQVPASLRAASTWGTISRATIPAATAVSSDDVRLSRATAAAMTATTAAMPSPMIVTSLARPVMTLRENPSRQHGHEVIAQQDRLQRALELGDGVADGRTRQIGREHDVGARRHGQHQQPDVPADDQHRQRLRQQGSPGSSQDVPWWQLRALEL